MENKIKVNIESLYPAWVCRECALKGRGCIINDGIDSLHVEGRCELCGEVKRINRSRDYGYPVFDTNHFGHDDVREA